MYNVFGCVSRRPSDLCCALYPVPTPTLHTHQHQSSQLQRTMVHPPVGISQRGHQPTWGQVSFIFAQHTAHLRFSVLFCSRPGACLIKSSAHKYRLYSSRSPSLVLFYRFGRTIPRSDHEGPPADMGPGKSMLQSPLYSHSFCLFCRFRRLFV